MHAQPVVTDVKLRVRRSVGAVNVWLYVVQLRAQLPALTCVTESLRMTCPAELTSATYLAINVVCSAPKTNDTCESSLLSSNRLTKRK